MSYCTPCGAESNKLITCNECGTDTYEDCAKVCTTCGNKICIECYQGCDCGYIEQCGNCSEKCECMSEEPSQDLVDIKEVLNEQVCG